MDNTITFTHKTDNRLPLSGIAHKLPFDGTVHYHFNRFGDFTMKCFKCKKDFGENNGYCKECGYCECNIIKITLPNIYPNVDPK